MQTINWLNDNGLTIEVTASKQFRQIVNVRRRDA